MDNRRAVFRALWLFIIFVSVVDGYLVYEHRSFIMTNELNPMGRTLLILNSGQIWMLLAAKFFGTVTACGILLLLERKNWRLSTAVAAAVASFQLALLLFLALA
jgi:hypothetical protein